MATPSQQQDHHLLDEISRSASEIFRLPAILEDICNTLHSEFQFEFITVQLVREDEHVIETVHGTGSAKAWMGQWRHFLIEEESLRDIQADIALGQRMEIITGGDERFDEWLFSEYQHDTLSRVFTPILIARDENSYVVEEWVDHYVWEQETRDDDAGKHGLSLTLRPIDPHGVHFRIETIGTVEAGRNVRSPISADEAKALARSVARHALTIRASLVPCVLETIAECTRKMAYADAAILDFGGDTPKLKYAFACPVGVSRRFMECNPPRQDGLGARAITSGFPQFADDIEESYPSVYRAGYQTTVAFPLFVDDLKGVIYLLFKRYISFHEDDIEHVAQFIKHSTDVIRFALNYTRVRNQAYQLDSLHAVLQSLVSRPQRDDLLWQVAGNSLNIFAADLVIIYEYYEADERFITPPAIAGRLRNPKDLNWEVRAEDVPYRIIRGRKSIFANNSLQEAALQLLGHEPPHHPFIACQMIASTGAILLKADGEVVGLMFINYRRTHAFTEDDKRLIATLSQSAAIAIKNRRMLSQLVAVDRLLATTPNPGEVLSLIVQGAARITTAKAVELHRLIPTDGKYVLAARHPELGKPYDLLSSAGQEIVREVTGMGQTRVVPISGHSQIGTGTVSYVLLIPLQDHLGVVGILALMSDDPGVFKAEKLENLAAMAYPAVVAIQIVARQYQFDAADRMAAIGQHTGPRMHALGNEIALIDVDLDRLRKTESLSPVVDSSLLKVSQRLETLRMGIERCLRAASIPKVIEVGRVVERSFEQMIWPDSDRVRSDNSVPTELARIIGHEDELIDFIRNKDLAIFSVAAGGSGHEDCVIHKPLPWPNPRLRPWCSVRHLSQCGSASRQRGHARP